MGWAKSREGQLRTRRSKTLTHGCVVGVGEALVHPLPHELPFVVGKIALDDLVVVLSQFFGGLQGRGFKTQNHNLNNNFTSRWVLNYSNCYFGQFKVMSEITMKTFLHIHMSKTKNRFYLKENAQITSWKPTTKTLELHFNFSIKLTNMHAIIADSSFTINTDRNTQ